MKIKNFCSLKEDLTSIVILQSKRLFTNHINIDLPRTYKGLSRLLVKYERVQLESGKN